MDMISENEQNNAKQAIHSTFQQNGVSQNFIVFGETFCQWDESELDEHSKQVDLFLNSIPPAEDYYVNMAKTGKLSTWLRIDENLYCKTPNCRHNFTEETQKE